MVLKKERQTWCHHQNKNRGGDEPCHISRRHYRPITLKRWLACHQTGNGYHGHHRHQDYPSSNEDQIASVYGFAEIMGHTIVEGLAENAAEMRQLVQSGTIELEQAGGGLLAGKSFCFTGELVTMTRADAEQLVKKNGGSIKSSVTKDLSYLVTNDTSSGSSKNVKAAKLGVPVIDEKQFLALFD